MNARPPLPEEIAAAKAELEASQLEAEAQKADREARRARREANRLRVVADKARRRLTRAATARALAETREVNQNRLALGRRIAKVTDGF